MSTEMKGTERLALTRFYGGDERGVCLQVTIREFTGFNMVKDEGWITVNKREALLLAEALLKFVYDTLEEEDADLL
jgi:hypothetical protein